MNYIEPSANSCMQSEVTKSVCDTTQQLLSAFGKAVEIELRNLFHRWRATMTTSERKHLAGEAGSFDRKLGFLCGNSKISMGDMDSVLRSARGTVTVYRSIFDFLSLHHPGLLDEGTKKALSELIAIRNREAHSHSPSCAKKAGELTEQIFQAMTLGR